MSIGSDPNAAPPRRVLARENLLAHRGMSEDAPENTPSAYRRAVERGFGFECDVYLTRDGRVFSFHDPTLKRIAGIVQRSNATGVALQFDPAIVTADYIAAFHRAGYYVNVWTVDDAKSALLAVERGADTVASNRPGQLLEEAKL